MTAIVLCCIWMHDAMSSDWQLAVVEEQHAQVAQRHSLHKTMSRQNFDILTNGTAKTITQSNAPSNSHGGNHDSDIPSKGATKTIQAVHPDMAPEPQPATAPAKLHSQQQPQNGQEIHPVVLQATALESQHSGILAF